MVKNSVRFCDECADEIPKGDKYSLRMMPAEAAVLLLDVEDTDLVPTWTQNADGTVRLEICATCCLSTGNADYHEPQ